MIYIPILLFLLLLCAYPDEAASYMLFERNKEYWGNVISKLIWITLAICLTLTLYGFIM